jgi:hypothetical protein
VPASVGVTPAISIAGDAFQTDVVATRRTVPRYIATRRGKLLSIARGWYPSRIRHNSAVFLALIVRVITFRYDLPVGIEAAVGEQNGLTNAAGTIASADQPPTTAESGVPQAMLPPTSPTQSARLSTATIEAVSKCALLGSAALYAIGLLITNFNAQTYGRYSLSLIEAQYVLVGSLWMALTLLSFAVTRSAVRWLKGHGPWRGRQTGKNLINVFWVLVAWMGLSSVYAQVMSLAGLENAFFGWRTWLSLAVLVFTNISLGALVEETWKDMNRKGAPGDSFLARLWKADSIQISKRILYFFMSLSLYSNLLYSYLSPAVGGGKLQSG